MNLKFMVGSIMALAFAFIFVGTALGVTADLVGKVTTAIAQGGPLEAFASAIQNILNGTLNAGSIAAALLPLGILAKIFGVDRIFE